MKVEPISCKWVRNWLMCVTAFVAIWVLGLYLGLLVCPHSDRTCLVHPVCQCVEPANEGDGQ